MRQSKGVNLQTGITAPGGRSIQEGAGAVKTGCRGEAVVDSSSQSQVMSSVEDIGLFLRDTIWLLIGTFVLMQESVQDGGVSGCV